MYISLDLFLLPLFPGLSMLLEYSERAEVSESDGIVFTLASSELTLNLTFPICKMGVMIPSNCQITCNTIYKECSIVPDREALNISFYYHHLCFFLTSTSLPLRAILCGTLVYEVLRDKYLWILGLLILALRSKDFELGNRVAWLKDQKQGDQKIIPGD